MRFRVRAVIVVASLVAAASCSPTPKPPTPAPTALVCPGSTFGDPGYVSSDQNRVVNGSFGMPAIRGRRSVSTLQGWAVNGPVKLIAAPSCLPFPDNQYVSLGFGASISQQVTTVAGATYRVQFSDSMEGVCNIAGTLLNAYWNAKFIGSAVTTAIGTTPSAAVPPWGGGVGTEGVTVIATSTSSVLRFVAANVAYSCALDVSNVSVEVEPPGTPWP